MPLATEQELEDRKAELRNKDREMEELEERHQVEIKVYKQKVRCPWALARVESSAPARPARPAPEIAARSAMHALTH